MCENNHIFSGKIIIGNQLFKKLLHKLIILQLRLLQLIQRILMPAFLLFRNREFHIKEIPAEFSGK